MSAFFCDAETIDLVVRAASDLSLSYTLPDGREVPVFGNQTMIGKILWAENARSVIHRYRLLGSEEAAGYIAQIDAYRWTNYGVGKPAAALKSADCLAYQPCKTDDWEKTGAHRLIAEIKAAFASHAGTAAYQAAPWGASERNVRDCILPGYAEA